MGVRGVVIKLCSVAPLWRTMLLSVALFLVQLAVIILSPLCSKYMGPRGSDTFFMLLLTGLPVVVIVYWIVAIFVKLVKRNVHLGLSKEDLKLFIPVGLCMGISGVCIVYASIPDRTPPYLQALLGVLVVPYTVVVRLVILRRGTDLPRSICVVFIVIGLVITAMPIVLKPHGDVTLQQTLTYNPSTDLQTMDYNVTSQTPASITTSPWRYIWPVIFALGFLPFAIVAVLYEKHSRSSLPSLTSTVIMLAYTNLFAYATQIFFFWTDLVPGFGMARDFSEFMDHFVNGVGCVFNTCGQCSDIVARFWLLGLCLTLAPFLQYLLTQYSDGAIYVILVLALRSPIGALFWYLFVDGPSGLQWQPHFDVYTWFVAGGLVIMVPAVVVYNYMSGRGKPEHNIEPTDAVIAEREGLMDKVTTV